MALRRNMPVNEIVDFINNELLEQVKQEIGIWIHPHKKRGGYFVATRQILCMVDFLGATYSGYSSREKAADISGKKERIATTRKAKAFIKKFFKPKNTYTNTVINFLYDIYRHGLVHLYQPRALKYNTRRALQWYFYRGAKRFYKQQTINTAQGKKTFKNVEYLKVLTNSPSTKYYYFPIGIDCLYEDFVNAVNDYRDKMIKTKTLQRKWRTAVNAICRPR